MTASYGTQGQPTIPLRLTGYDPSSVTASLRTVGHVEFTLTLSRGLDPYEAHAADRSEVRVDHHNKTVAVHVNADGIINEIDRVNQRLADFEHQGKALQHKVQAAKDLALQTLSISGLAAER